MYPATATSTTTNPSRPTQQQLSRDEANGDEHHNTEGGLVESDPQCCNETFPLVLPPMITSITNLFLGNESNFGAEEEKANITDKKEDGINDDKGDEEGQRNNNMTELEERPITIIPPNTGTSESNTGGFDVCREYGYKYDTPEDQNDDDDSSCNQLAESAEQPLHHRHVNTTNSTTTMAISNMPTTTNENLPYISVLGKTYHPIHEYDARRQDENSLFWFTYRCDFPEIVPYGITSDAGWGCMLRSAQMILAQALRIHYKTRQWRPPVAIHKRRLDPLCSNILTWFADFPSKGGSIYSLHNMVAAGLARYQTLPGEWYGPGTACHVLRDLTALHEQQFQSDMFRVHVASEGTVYRSAVHTLMTRDSTRRFQQRQKQKEDEEERNGKTTNDEQKEQQPIPLHPLDPAALVPESNSEENTISEWDTAMLLLVPLRLGLNNFNRDYERSLAASFALPQSVGVLGGRPRGARWFYGAYLDGSKVLGLDPHTVQLAPGRRPIFGPSPQDDTTEKATSKAHATTSTSAVDLSDDYIRSLHTAYPETFPISRMDPSIALGFYCRDRTEFQLLEESLEQFKIQPSTKDCPDLFTFADEVPDYLSSAMNEMMLNDDELDDGCGLQESDNINDVVEEESDEDDYVML